MTTARSEQRFIRPYRALDPIQVLLDNHVSMWRGEVECEQFNMLEPSEFTQFLGDVQVELEMDVVRTAITNAGLAPEDVDLVVFATGRSLKSTVIPFRRSLGVDWPEDRVEVKLCSEEDPFTFADAARGFDVSVAMVLSRDIARQPLVPFRAGTWLAKRSYSFSPKHSEIVFAPRPMSDEDRAAFGLPAGAALYVTTEETITSASSVLDCMDLWVDAKLLGLVQSSPNTAQAVALQATWARIAAQALLEYASKHLKDTSVPISELAEQKGTVWSVLRDRILKAHPELDATEVSTMLIKEPLRLTGYFESTSGVLKQLISNMGE